MNEFVFGRPKVRFGNVWAYTSRMVLYAEEHGLKEVLLSHKSKRLTLIQEMWEEFDTNAIIKVVEKDTDERRRFGVPDHKKSYAKTKKQWKGNVGRICYQIATNSKRTDQIITENHGVFLKGLEEQGYELVKLGLPMTLSESIEVMCDCELFVGIDSGMSHMAHSIGIPVYLKGFPRLKKTHVGKDYKTFENSTDLINKLK
jgi:hypothetical protein